jgi:AcrR family transcriptional regulator
MNIYDEDMEFWGMTKNVVKRENKRALVLEAMEKLIMEGKAASCTVGEIAKTAGIGKGSVYYYYNSKEEVETDLYFKIFDDFIDGCKFVLDVEAGALEKLELLFVNYYTRMSKSICNNRLSARSMLDAYLHLPQNAAIHQKTIAHATKRMACIMAKILRQGVKEGVIECKEPEEQAQIMVGLTAFLFDAGIFKQIPQEIDNRMRAFAEIMERNLKAEKGKFSYLYEKFQEINLALRFNSENPPQK